MVCRKKRARKERKHTLALLDAQQCSEELARPQGPGLYRKHSPKSNGDVLCLEADMIV